MGWKPVRDRNQEVVTKWGVVGSWEKVDDITWIKALGRKLVEEATEFTENYDPDELWDLYDVLEELIRLHPSICDGRRTTKMQEMGGFRDRIMYTPVPNVNTNDPYFGIKRV